MKTKCKENRRFYYGLNWYADYLGASDICIYIIILEVIINWLIIFDVINVRNDKAQNLLKLLKKMTDPVYSKIRKFVPPIAGIDLTPLIVIFGIYFLQMLVGSLFFRYGYYGF